MQRQRLVRELVDSADAHLEIDAGVRGFAGDLEADEQAALASGHRGAAAAAGLGVEADPRRAGMLLDHRARERRADLLIAGEQRHHRRGRAAELLDRSKDKTVHHQAGLHVGHARSIGAVAVDLERPPRRLALGKTVSRWPISRIGRLPKGGKSCSTVAEMASPNV